MGGRRTVTAAIAALGAALVLAPSAHASFHLISIREVYPGSAAHPASGYVELQMYASGQNFVGGHALTVYGATGVATGTFTFPTAVANGANQQTILIGDSEVQGEFGVSPDLAAPALEIQASGGAACWAGSIDCVSWGSFSGSTPSPSGSPADPLGIPDGMALRRTIEPGCPTLLEAADDTNDSATDFLDTAAAPRNNSSSISESACTGPAATVDSHPANPTNLPEASFTYHSTPAGGSFECRLDVASYATCPASGIEYPGPLGEGSHTFQVRAKDVSENVGTPASFVWRVDTTAPGATIDSHPADPSSGASASFSFHASETGSTFECSLADLARPSSFSACASGKTYTGLANGTYVFEVRATDTAGNRGVAATFEWEVDNALADTMPPQTTILTKPPNPSDSPTASFTYESNEPGSTFECSFDGVPFASCPVGGVAYTGLLSGPHNFAVRAIDPSENVDPTPAGYSFDVAVPTAPPPASIAPPPPLAVTAPPPPDTRIISKLRRRIRDRTPTLRFRSNVAGAGFQCSVDRARFRRCRSPFTTKRLRPGQHRVRVRARLRGVVDPTPARKVFRVIRDRRRHVTRRHRRHGQAHRHDRRRQGRTRRA